MQLLDPSALLEQLPKLLPQETELKNPQDAISALIHTILTKLSFRLTSLSDIPNETKVNEYVENKLPKEWSKNGPSTYTFRYAHEQSSMTFILKIISLSSRLIIHATSLESNRTESIEIEIDRFTSKSFWPFPNSTSEPLVNGFISSSRISDFILLFQSKIIQKLIPGLRKEGYEEIQEDNSNQFKPSTNPSTSSQQQQQPRIDPQEQFYQPPIQSPPFRNPLIIGDRDLDPLAGNNPLGRPPPLFGGGDHGGGMIVGPDHPIFRDRFQQPQQPFAGGIVPPGARFDPVTPFGQRPIPGRNPNQPRRPPFGMGEPDWDEMPPPGGNNDYDNMFM